jgi:signal peptidase I
MERSVAREYLEALIIAAMFLRFTNTWVVQTFYIPSGSMENTLLIGDHLFVNRFIYGPAATGLERRLLPLRDPERGDVVIFRKPDEPGLDLVKRAMARPGDTIQEISKRIYINGKAVDDSSYAIHTDPVVHSSFSAYEPLSRRDNFGPTEIPENRYFCMGDNRDNSNDSRFWGLLPRHLVKGRALFIYWSNGGETSAEWHGLGAQLRSLAKTALGFFSKTRWSRTFHLIR